MGALFRHRPALLVLAIGAAALLAGCGSSSGSGSSGSSGSGSGGKSTTQASSSSGGYGGGYGSGSSSSSGSASTGGTTLKLTHASVGQILVDSRGYTVYQFTADHPNTDSCVKVTGCTSTWPPLTVSGQATAGSGVKKSLLGTIKLPNGRHQVTYAGHPLYTYSGDSSQANTSYLGVSSFGGTWLAVSATGSAVH
jgi:predicted lipoprotein with Yx(FWY)xxD motif